jgi:BirA family biotin operon repressor/biotin-[acetyl-CoA-carboxylase] ligase
LTYNQTKGKGQRGNTWDSEVNKNISCSYYITLNKLKIENVFLISMAVANAIHKFISIHFNNSKIKWPNDILINNKKVCGVLIENSVSGKHISQSIIGIGININQEKFSSLFNATSFKLERDVKWDLNIAFNELKAFLNTEINALNNGYSDTIKNYYLNNLIGYKTIKSYTELTNNKKAFEGKITNVENSGLLVMQTNKDIKKYSFKEIEFIL